MKEYKLIQSLQKQNAKVQKFVYNKYAPKFLTVCMRYLKDKPLAEDVLIQGFVKIFREVKKYKSTGKFEAWMYKIMVNECLMEIRKNNNLTLRLESVYQSNTNDKNALDNLFEEDLLNIVLQLPTGCRTVFNLFIIEGYSHKEIAYKLNIKEGTSKSQLNLAKTKLKKIIKTQYKNLENGR